jgi:hypothetical protein
VKHLLHYLKGTASSAYIFVLLGGPIMWMSESQNTVALLLTEAELTALSEAVKQALYI